MHTKRKGGQILILVLLVVVVSLSIGLSVASRNLSNLKISSQTEQSQRAYALAESGVEKILADLQNIKNNPNIATGYTAAPVFDKTHASDFGQASVVASQSFTRQVPLGEVAQINLSGGTATKYNLAWAKTANINECAAPASLEVTLVFTNFVGDYLQRRWYFSGVGSLPPNTPGLTRGETYTSFDSTGASDTYKYNNNSNQGSAYGGATVCAATSFSLNTTTTYTSFPTGLCPNQYVNCAVIDTDPISVTGSRKLLRIRPLWNDTTLYISAYSNALPTQEYNITSTSSVGNGVTRKLLVQKSALPSVPAIFDFALYSEGDITK